MEQKLTTKQMNFIKDNLDNYTPKEFTEMFNVHPNSIAGMISNIKNNRGFWTKEEEQFLIENKDKMTLKQLKQKLNKTKRIISYKLNSLGLKKKNFGELTRFKKNEPHPRPEIKIPFDILYTLYIQKEMTTDKICKKLNVSWNVLKKNLVRYSIKIRGTSFYHKGKPKPYMIRRMEGKNNPNYEGKLWQDDEYRKKMTFAIKRLWQDINWKNKHMELMAKAQNIKPNKPETMLINLFKQHGLPYKYVGDGKLWIEGKNPDFINCNGQKKIIELFGDYWHSVRVKYKKEDYISPEKRKEIFKKYGYDTLVIWEHELNDIPQVTEKIMEFER